MNRLSIDEEKTEYSFYGYLICEGICSAGENNALCQITEDIVVGRRKMLLVYIDHNTLVRDGKEAWKGICSIEKI